MTQLRSLWVIFLVICSAFCGGVASAQSEPQRVQDVLLDGDVRAFGQLPVLHQGRVKALSILADTFLSEVSHTNRAPLDDATRWFVQLVFDFETARTEPVFFVSHDVVEALSLEPVRGSLYDFDTIFEAFKAQKDAVLAIEKKSVDARDEIETAVFSLYVTMDRFFVLGQSFEPFLRDITLSTALKEQLGLERRTVSVSDLFAHLGTLERMSQEALGAANGDLQQFSLLEQEVASLSFLVSKAYNVARGNDLLRVIPSKWQQGDVGAQSWETPALLQVSGHASDEGAQLIGHWLEMRAAYNQGVRSDFALALESAKTLSTELMAYSSFKLYVGWAYHAFGVLNIALGLYVVSLAVFLIGRVFAVGTAAADLTRLFVMIGVSVGVFVHALAIVMRSFVLMRPPVGTLYESIVFVGLVCVLCALVLPRFSRAIRWDLAMGLALFSGIALLSLRFTYLPAGDSMGVLVAVLNTNFWLTTHVLTITIGYGLCFILGVLGHLYLFKPSRGVMRAMVTLALVSLLFTGVGTLLGGVWADQSWGRFWGWDPKENGALVITLWLVWVLHGRLSSHMSDAVFAAFSAAITIIVALSWFGVNLLGVGLHSYGFTSGAIYGLALFCLAEIAVIYSLYMRGQAYDLYQ